MAGFKADWVGYFRRNYNDFTKKDADAFKFRNVRANVFAFKGEEFEFPTLPNGGQVDRLMAYTYCRYVRACRRFGVDPEPFVIVTKDSV